MPFEFKGGRKIAANTAANELTKELVGELLGESRIANAVNLRRDGKGVVWYTMWSILMDMTKAKVFMNGRSQAVRLPKEFRVQSREVYLQKTQDGFKVLERDPWDTFVEGCRELSEEALSSRKQPRLEKRERI